jgi:hypothetical protein
MWIGEYTLGDRVPLTLWVRSSDAPTVPDDPVRAIISSATAQVESLLLPITDVVKSELHRFVVLAGGNANGTGIATEYFAVSPSSYILVQNDNGTLIRRKNPSIS